MEDGSRVMVSSTVYNSVTVCSFFVRVPDNMFNGGTGSQTKRHCTCLVRADNGNRPKGFDRMEFLHDRLAPRHAKDAEGEGDRGDNW